MCRILNFGSLNLDTVISISHIVKPGETLSASKVESFCGGKGFNQSVAMARAGLRVFHAGKLGNDGGLLKTALLETGVDCRYLLSSPGKTGSALIQRAQSGENCIIIDGGANREITQEEIRSILKEFSPGDILVCQNEISHLPALLEAAGENQLRVAFNPSPIDDALLSYDLSPVEWLVLNEVEGKDLTGKTEPEEITAALIRKYPGCKIVLTLGAEGSAYAEGDQFFRCKAVPAKVVDTTAAGDTFLGYFLASVLNSESAPEALRRASFASSLAISVIGAYPSIPTAEQVERDMQQ